MDAAVDPAELQGARLVNRDCPACASGARRPLMRYSRDPWIVVECLDCGFVYLRDAPTYDRLVDEIAWEKSHEVERQRRRSSRPISFWISRGLRNFHVVGRKRRKRNARRFGPGPVLDIGCGSADDVPDGHTPYGIEISKELHAIADRQMRARGGHALHMPAIQGVSSFPDGFFSGAILSSYLEHEMKPAELLSQLARVLRRGGRAYVRVPNFGSVNRKVRGGDWSGLRHPDHVNYFTLDSLRAMADRAGFDLTLINRLILPVDDNINAILVRR